MTLVLLRLAIERFATIMTESDGDCWIFGYGSIVWKVGFPTVEVHEGYVEHYVRRFWQGSPDHRGVPGALGRVVTLLHVHDLVQFEEENHEMPHMTWGKVYRVAEEHRAAVLAQLEHREQAGYEKRTVDVRCRDGQTREALVFIATPENATFLGPASLEIMAEEIASRSGPSGPNHEYLFQLHRTLEQMNIRDSHIQALARATQEILSAAQEQS